MIRIEELKKTYKTVFALKDIPDKSVSKNSLYLFCLPLPSHLTHPVALATLELCGRAPRKMAGVTQVQGWAAKHWQRTRPFVKPLALILSLERR